VETNLVRAGPLDRRIAIQGQTISQSDSGEEVVTWSTVATVFAAKVELHGAERFAAKQLTGKSVVTFRFRWSEATAAITSEHRIIYGGREYDVTDVREIGRREGIEVDANTASEEPLKEPTAQNLSLNLYGNPNLFQGQ
jgi:SPP1 family predicted phage head-tail adaptor